MIDLHMHSRYSEDGEFTPTELAEQCRQAGVTVMSVTDHNCARANQEARAAAEDRGIRYLTGIEIDCVDKGIGLHLLGYGFRADSPDFARAEQRIADQALAASIERLARAKSGLSARKP